MTLTLLASRGQISASTALVAVSASSSIQAGDFINVLVSSSVLNGVYIVKSVISSTNSASISYITSAQNLSSASISGTIQFIKDEQYARAARVYSANAGKWISIGGRADTGSNYSWTGTHIFNAPVSFNDQISYGGNSTNNFSTPVFHQKGSNIFANAAERDSVITSPVAGIVVFLVDSGKQFYYTGSTWSETVSNEEFFYKNDSYSSAFTRTSASTVSIKAGTKIASPTTSIVTFVNSTNVNMPTLNAGTDYFIYVTATGSASAVAATSAWPTPVASAPLNSVLIGGFHYAPGGNAPAQDGGNTTPSINEYSFWDLKWRPAAPDPRGMALIANNFWSDIYLLNRSPDTQGTSKHGVAIHDGETASTTTAFVPAIFGGTGSARYATASWWNTSECLSAYGKRLPTYQEFANLAYGVKENFSVNADPVNTGLVNGSGSGAGIDTNANKYTSKWGIIQASGTMLIWGNDFGGGAAAAAWANTNGGRGQVYQQENAVLLGGNWAYTVLSGSRTAIWANEPSSSSNEIGGRGVCNHLRLV